MYLWNKYDFVLNKGLYLCRNSQNFCVFIRNVWSASSLIFENSNFLYKLFQWGGIENVFNDFSLWNETYILQIVKINA